MAAISAETDRSWPVIDRESTTVWLSLVGQCGLALTLVLRPGHTVR